MPSDDHEPDRNARETQMEEWRMRWEASLEKWRSTVRMQELSIQGVIRFATVSIQSLILVNGAAVVVILAFLGDLWGTNSALAQATATAIIPGLAWFVVGTAAGVLTGMFSYIAQVLFTELTTYHDDGAANISWWAHVGRGVAVTCGAVSISAFGLGAWLAVRAFADSTPT